MQNGQGGSIPSKLSVVEGLCAVKMFSVLRCIVLPFSTRSIHAGDRLEELYASVPKEESERIGVTDSLIRLSVGLLKMSKI